MVEYSWLPANPKKVRVRRPKPHTDQMRLDLKGSVSQIQRIRY